MASAIESYFIQSEQLKTRFWFAVNGHQAVGLLLQELPTEVDKQGDWERLEILTDTISDNDLLTLPPTQIIHRLFHQETVRLYPPQAVSFNCDCSQQKVEASLISLGHDELNSILQEKGTVDIHCDYCNRHFQFDPIDIDQLFNPGHSGDSTSRH